MTMVHDIDFLADETTQELLAKEGLSPKDIFETQLLSIGAMAGSFVAKKLAHMNLSNKFVAEVFDKLVISAVSEEGLGRVPTLEESKQAIHMTLHLLCAMNKLISDMVEHEIISVNRAAETATKLQKLAESATSSTSDHRVH